MSVFSMDDVVRILRSNGISAYVEQTGGGCATIYAGEQRIHGGSTAGPNRRIGGGKRWDACAGPGWFVGPGWTSPRADRSDFAIGIDDDGESDPQFIDESWSEADIARAIASVVNNAV